MGYVRFILAIAVAAGHLQSWTYGAPDSTIVWVGPIVAVKLFFVISGFYMALAFGAYPTAIAFYAGRAARLFPIYWLTCLACIVAAIVIGSRTVPPFIDLTVWAVVAEPSMAFGAWTVSNLTFAGLDLGLFLCARISEFGMNISAAHNAWCQPGQSLLLSYAFIQPAWTLSLEWYFYLLVPLIFRARSAVLIAIAAASGAVAVVIALTNDVNPWNRSFFPAELYLFLLGFLACRLKDRIPSVLSKACAAISLVTILFYQHLPVLQWDNANSWNLLLYLSFAAGLPAVFYFGERLPLQGRVGDLSYPIYISHVLVESVIFTMGLHAIVSLPLWIAVNLTAIVATSSLLLWAASPIDRARSIFKSRRQTRGDLVAPSAL